MHTRHPSSIAPQPGQLPNIAKWGPDASLGATVHAWRPGHWYSWMFGVGRQAMSPGQTTWVVRNNTNGIYGLLPAPRTSNAAVKYLGDVSHSDACWAKCNATAACNDWTWHTPSFPGGWGKGCYTTRDGAARANPQLGVVAGQGPLPGSPELFFHSGGNQGGEGNDAAGEWWIEGVAAELDAENEFVFDSATRRLYFWYNGTEASPPPTLVAPSAATLFSVRGSAVDPVANFTLSNVNVTGTRPTFMDARGNPSGGDWALERSGALLLEGTTGATVTGVHFSKCESNAVFLSGYNRAASIERNIFTWLGQSAIASWGRVANGNDGTGGEQPRGTVVRDNWASEVGVLQKQSSFYFQALTAQALIANNIVFNIPRAAINFNDGFGGANEIVNNLLFNTCRESSDHGAFNSWDRLPYLTTVRDGATVSTIPAFNNVHANFIVANFAADGGCLDNDDGSSYYDIHHNVCVFGGHKGDFDGACTTTCTTRRGSLLLLLLLLLLRARVRACTATMRASRPRLTLLSTCHLAFVILRVPTRRQQKAVPRQSALVPVRVRGDVPQHRRSSSSAQGLRRGVLQQHVRPPRRGLAVSQHWRHRRRVPVPLGHRSGGCRVQGRLDPRQQHGVRPRGQRGGRVRRQQADERKVRFAWSRRGHAVHRDASEQRHDGRVDAGHARNVIATAPPVVAS
jgi:hypothetical protein